MTRIELRGVDDCYLGHPDEGKDELVRRTTFNILQHNIDGFVRIDVGGHIYSMSAAGLIKAVKENTKNLPKVEHDE